MKYKIKHENTVLKSKLTHFFPKRYDIIKLGTKNILKSIIDKPYDSRQITHFCWSMINVLVLKWLWVQFGANKHDKIVICSLWTIDYDYG